VEITDMSVDAKWIPRSRSAVTGERKAWAKSSETSASALFVLPLQSAIAGSLIGRTGSQFAALGRSEGAAILAQAFGRRHALGLLIHQHGE
jgi:hypothetical protein